MYIYFNQLSINQSYRSELTSDFVGPSSWPIYSKGESDYYLSSTCANSLDKLSLNSSGQHSSTNTRMRRCFVYGFAFTTCMSYRSFDNCKIYWLWLNTITKSSLHNGMPPAFSPVGLIQLFTTILQCVIALDICLASISKQFIEQLQEHTPARAVNA